MDIFDADECDFLLPRRTRKAIAFAPIIGVAFVPPVKRWYLDQIEPHAQHITREFMSELTSDTTSLTLGRLTLCANRRLRPDLVALAAGSQGVPLPDDINALAKPAD